MYGLLAQLSLVLLVSFAISSWVFWAMDQAWLWKRAIRRFEKSDLVDPSQPRVVVFTGSSSINFWKNLAQDMGPLNVLNRGFGGSQMAHVTRYARKIVLPHSPVRRLPRSAAMEIELMGEGG